MQTSLLSILSIVLEVAINRCVGQVPFDEYHCGTDVTSRFSSFLMTMDCDQIGINVCCGRHDNCYSSCALTQLACDVAFCECLFALNGGLFCRNVVHASHCNAVQWLGHNYICPPMAQPLIG